MIYEIINLTTIIIAIIYFLIGVLIHLGLSKRYKRTIHMPKVSVLIAARNEAATIADCLKSMKTQDYPAERLQFIIINDRSTDDTRTVIQEHLPQLPASTLIDIEDELGGLKGKMNALAQGMNYTEGEIILVTDADCRVPKSWVSQMVSYFDDNVGLVGSLTGIQKSETTSPLFNNVQRLDMFFLQAIAAGTAGVGLPVSVLGNNFGFKKSAYEQIGGFASIGFSLTEDLALLHTINKKTDFEIAYPLYHKSMIKSLPLSNFHDFIQQRKRWLSGGVRSPLWGWILMSTSFIAHLLILINLVLLNLSTFAIFSFAMLIIIDVSLIWKVIRLSDSKGMLRYFIPFEIFYFVYTIILAASMIFPGKIYWKERDFDKKT